VTAREIGRVTIAEALERPGEPLDLALSPRQQ
jgi:hypothetical protein